MKTCLPKLGLFLLAMHAINPLEAMPLPLRPIVSYQCKSCHTLSREPVNFAWPLENNDFYEKISHETISRKYVIRTSIYQLQSTGVILQTQAPGAVIRITAVNRKFKIPAILQVQNNQSQTFTLQEATDVVSDSADLKDTYFNQSTGLGPSLGFQLKENIGSGQIILRLPQGINLQQFNKRTTLLVHVFDKNASSSLYLNTDKARYQYGQKVNVNLYIRDKNINYPLNQLNAFLVGPSGEKTQLTLRNQSNNVYETALKLDAREIKAPGRNHEVLVEASTIVNGQEIKRQAHTFVSYAIPSASLYRINRFSAQPFGFVGHLKVATASRYAIEAILFARDEKKRRIPIQHVQSAAWLEPGDAALYFTFDKPLKKKYLPPYEIGYLRLIDFNQLKPIYEYLIPIDLNRLQ